jgi:hypothetical protein
MYTTISDPPFSSLTYKVNDYEAELVKAQGYEDFLKSSKSRKDVSTADMSSTLGSLTLDFMDDSYAGGKQSKEGGQPKESEEPMEGEDAIARVAFDNTARHP